MGRLQTGKPSCCFELALRDCALGPALGGWSTPKGRTFCSARNAVAIARTEARTLRHGGLDKHPSVRASYMVVLFDPICVDSLVCDAASFRAGG